MSLSQRPKTIEIDPETNAVPTFDVRDLIPGGVQARLVLDGQAYVLRITRAGKLILTK
ncbi:MAG: hemin uptake protein HemP [Sulfitobacter sp.]|jgi:hemin uptake protein HemP